MTIHDIVKTVEPELWRCCECDEEFYEAEPTFCPYCEGWDIEQETI